MKVSCLVHISPDAFVVKHRTFQGHALKAFFYFLLLEIGYEFRFLLVGIGYELFVYERKNHL